MVGGAPMSPANAERMIEKLGCQYVSGYGLTETTPQLTVGNLKSTLLEEETEAKMNYITRTGLEVVGVDLRVVDENGNDVPWDNTTVGEIVVRGDNVMKGYWNLSQATDKAIQEGYFRTGDLATIDDQGYVLIVDRAKIIQFCKERLATFKVPKQISFLPELPKTGSGKILKTEFRKQYKAE